MSDSPDLSLALLDDILAELRKRYDSFIFSYTNNIDKDSDDVAVYWHGGKMPALGLAELTKEKILGASFDDDDEEL